MSSADLVVEEEQSWLVVRLNRPQRRNALSLQLMRELLDCLSMAGESGRVRAVILTASGSVFCSGHDLGELRGRGVDEYRETFAVCTRLMEKIQSIPQPVIAAVQGLATAAGCQLVATCDLALASTEAAFATPGVRIGLFCTTPMVALTRAIGRKRALEMLLTGKAIDAATAAQWGLVNRVVEPGELLEAARELARQISSASPYVVGLGKQAFYAQVDAEQSRAYAYAKEVMTRNATSEDAQEGIGAFLDKRTPCWKGS